MISTKKLCYKIVDKISSLATTVAGIASDVTTLQGNVVQSDWAEADNTKYDFIKNKPTYTSTIGVYTESGVSIDVYQYDKLVFLHITATKATAIPASTNVFSVTGGDANNLPKPNGNFATGAGFYSANTISAFMAVQNGDVTVTVRNTGSATILANSTLHVTMAYMTA